jgi:hypothetical protein
MYRIPSVAVAPLSLTVRLLLSRIQAKAGDMSSISAAEPTCRDVGYLVAIVGASHFVGFNAGIPPLDSANPDVF